MKRNHFKLNVQCSFGQSLVYFHKGLISNSGSSSTEPGFYPGTLWMLNGHIILQTMLFIYQKSKILLDDFFVLHDWNLNHVCTVGPSHSTCSPCMFFCYTMRFVPHQQVLHPCSCKMSSFYKPMNFRFLSTNQNNTVTFVLHPVHPIIHSAVC